MILKNCDILSEKICLYFQGKNRHSSKVSGILSIIMVLICIIYLISSFMDIALHKSRNFMSYRQYIKDVEPIFFNNEENGIFHYFQLITNKNKIQEFDTKYIRIVMTRIHQGYINDFNLLENYEHWIYDKCRDGIDNKNLSKTVFNENNNINGGACLRYYYNIENNKYYTIDDKNFKYPYLVHGVSSHQNLLLNSNIAKCTNNSILSELLGPCENQDKIDAYLKNLTIIYLKLTEKQINSENYSNPILSYINGIFGTIDVSDVPINNIYLSPVLIKIKKGIFFPQTEELSTIQYENNVLSMWSNKEQIEHMLAIYNFWILNSCTVIKGGYETLYDLLPNLGGMIKFIYYSFFVINYLDNKFITIHDSARLFLRTNEKQSIKDRKKEYKFTKIVKEIRQDNKKYIQNPNYSDNSDNFSLYKKNIISNKNNNRNFNRKSYNKINDNSCFSALNQNNLLDLNKKNNCLFFYNNNNGILKKSNNFLSPILYRKSYNEFNYINSKRKNGSFSNFRYNNLNKFSGNFEQFLGLKKKNIKLEEAMSDSYLAKYTSFFYYLISFLGRPNKKGKLFYILTSFRKKLLSEEHFFKAHIYLYYLEKYFDINDAKKIDIAKLYNYL